MPAKQTNILGFDAIIADFAFYLTIARSRALIEEVRAAKPPFSLRWGTRFWEYSAKILASIQIPYL